MANWIEKSFSLVAKGGYLDSLAEIYPPPPTTPRRLKKNERELIKEAFESNDDRKLLALLLQLEKFPFNDPYVSFLRKRPEEIARNPITTGRICGHLREMGLKGIIGGLEEPKQFNRQMGAMFSHWIPKKYAIAANVEEFNSTQKKPIFLGLAGEKLRQYANQNGCGIQKQPDFIAKAKNKLIVGEAKFIGTEGGNQNRAFEDALKLASSSFKHATTVAVLDGIIWIPESGQMSRRLSNFSGNAVTALLLDDFLSSL